MRLIKSLIAGAIIAAVIVGYEATARRAALTVALAKSGAHQSVQATLVDSFVGIALVVAFAFFLVSSVAAGRASRRPAPAPAKPQRRRVGAGR